MRHGIKQWPRVFLAKRRGGKEGKEGPHSGGIVTRQRISSRSTRLYAISGREWASGVIVRPAVTSTLP